ncbi:MAG: hypothetical protein A2516_12150 [Alphaproteobacteria bacterium RIFOXYD12_FULL_60_8]|nr:MAG: hypothetical protein A2516_12150 [Alphaproteobacteria bacterium RIFOXYD12_FULL_60_8]
MTSVSPWIAIGAVAFITYASRYLGTLLSQRISKKSQAFVWLTYVTHALVAALIARMLILPIGPMAEAGLFERGVAVGLGLAVFFLTRRNLLAGIGAGTAGLVALMW